MENESFEHLSSLLIKPTHRMARLSFRRFHRVSATNHAHKARSDGFVFRTEDRGAWLENVLRMASYRRKMRTKIAELQRKGACL